MIRLVCCIMVAFASFCNTMRILDTRFGRTSRILGGQDVSILDYPYMLVFSHLHRNGGSMCAAAIISEHWAVTSAHCVKYATASQLRIHSNVTDLNLDSAEFGVDGVVVHPLSRVTEDTADYDIALIKVTPPFRFGPGTQAVGLPEQDQDTEPGARGTIAGWGQAVIDDKYPSLSEVLQAGTVPIINQTECVQIYANAPQNIRSEVTARMICAKGTSSVCMGDSGGPLLVDGQLVGIASWGSEKCYDFPTVFTRVAYFRDWIRVTSGL